MHFRPDDTVAAYLARRKEGDGTPPVDSGRLLTGPLDPANLCRTVDCMREGGVVVFYSTLTYGIATSAYSREGVEKIYRMKKRDGRKALCMLASQQTYRRWVTPRPEIQDAVEALVQAYWPGPLNMVLPKATDETGAPLIPDYVTAGMPSLAVVCMDAEADALVAAADFPIVNTSANLSGEPPVVDSIDAIKVLGDQPDLYLLGGRCPVCVNATLVDLCGDPPRILRPGPIAAADIRRFLPTLVGD